MANPLKSLPKEVTKNIRAYASDKYAPHPMAEAIRALDFKYELHAYETVLRNRGSQRVSYGYYHSPALIVSGDCYHEFLLADFAEPDRYVEDSNRQSGIKLGRVVGDAIGAGVVYMSAFR